MKCTAREVEGIVIVNIEGNLDTTSSPIAKDHFDGLIKEGKKKLLVNLQGLDYIASSGLRILLMLAKELEKEKGKVTICNLNTVVKEVFDISGFSYILKVFDSESEAFESMKTDVSSLS